MASGVVALIRVEAIWLATEPLDMRAGTDTVLARVVKVFGAARPRHAYLFTNKRATRIKVLVYDGIGIWLAARRLNRGRRRCVESNWMRWCWACLGSAWAAMRRSPCFSRGLAQGPSVHWGLCQWLE